MVYKIIQYGRAFVICGLALLALFLAGCAEVDFSSVKSNHEDNSPSTTGIRYFDSSAYILFQHDPSDLTGKAYTNQIVYLPDESKKRQAEVWCVLAQNTSSFTFTNAILTDTSVATDTTVIPVAVLNGLETVLGAALKVGVLAFDGAPKDPDVMLFKIVQGKDSHGKKAWGVVGAYASSTSR